MTRTPLIDIQGLTRSYPQTNDTIFQDLMMKIYEQDFCFVVGKSGVGKTTLVKFLIRHLQPPTKMIFYNKEDIARFSKSEVQAYRNKVGVVFQDFKLIDWKNVEENILYPLQINAIDLEEQEQRLVEILQLLDIEHKRYSKIPLLSGGEKQRVAIGRALINKPDFIILDEPTGNLDWEASKHIADLLAELNQQGNTIVCITHDQQLIHYIERKITPKTIELLSSPTI